MKKLKKAFVFILTIALVLTNIPLSVFADSAAETGLLKTTEKNEITIPMIHSVAMLPIGDESFTEHFVSVFFFISGKDLEPQRIKVKVDKDGQEQDEIQQTLKTGKMGTSISANIRFPLNDTDIPQNYKVYFYIGDSNKIDESKSVNVVIPNKKVGVAPAPDPGDPSNPKPIIPPPTAADHSILRVSEENFSLSEKGGEVSFDLFTSRGTPLEKVRVSILLNGNPFEPKENDLQITGEKAKKSVKLMIPENTTDQEQVYILKFNATGSATDFQDLPIVTIKVAPQENIIPKIDGFMIITPNLPKEGGKTTITVKGTDLTKENIIIKIWKIVGEDHLEQKELSNNVKFDGEGKTYSATLTFPPSGNAADRYLIKAGTAEDKMTHEGVVTVGENTSGEIIVLQPTSIYINSKGSQITLRFDEPIFAVKDIEDVKNGISLDIDGDKVFEKLDPQDKVEIIDNLLLVSLDKAIETNTNSKIRLEERILKDSRSREGKRNEYFIQRSVPMIFKAEFLEGEKLDHNGGRVRIRFTGENLLKTVGDKELKPIVQVLELQAKSSDQKVIENTNERSTDTEQIFSFIAPENKTSRARSYMVRVSLDGGRTFSSAIGVNMYDRTKKSIVTVFPEGADMNAPVLSFVSIQSYGTIGGGKEEPDRTITEVPTLQESKKTLAHIYGSNLKKELTKIKIIDKNGIEWTPVHDPASDSADQFIMVGFDATGLDGNGNNQLAEIICPNNIAGDQEFRYLIAVDGKNFDQEVFVTAKVLDDGLPGKRSLAEDQIKEISISYVSEDEVSIAPAAKTRGYKWNKAVSYNVRPIDIDGYKIKGYYAIKKASDGSIASKTDLNDVSVLNDRLKDIDEIRFVYQKTETDNDVPTPNVPNERSQGASASRSSVRPDPVSKKSETIKEDKTPLSTPENSFAIKMKVGSDRITKVLNGQESKLNAREKIIVQNTRPLIPLRAVAEALDIKIFWRATDKTILLSDDQNEIKFMFDPTQMNINGNKVSTKTSSIIKNGRTFLSIEAMEKILEVKGYTLRWDPKDQELVIIK